MDFDLTEEHRMLSESLRRVLAGDSGLEHRNAVAYTAPYHDPDGWRRLAELGVLAAFVDEADGGFGGGAEDVSVVFEEIGRGLCAEPLLGSLLALRLLARFGRADLVEEILAGTARGALAFAEPGLSVDLPQTTARAQQRGGTWQLTGRKSAVYGAPGAQHVLITACTAQGIGLFLVETPQVIDAGMIDGGGIGDLEMKGLQAECLAENALGPVEDALDMGRIALCAEAVGAMSCLIDMTVDYLKQRRQFGKPLAAFQVLQHRVVDMVMECEQARSSVIRAAASYAKPEQARHVAMAKNLIGRVAPFVAKEAIQLHGGIGMTWEYPGAHYAKRLVMIEHQLGDRVDHAKRLIGMNRRATEPDRANREQAAALVGGEV